MASLSGSYMLVALLCVVPWLAVAAHAPGTTGTSRRAMPWLCLERCSDNIANDMRLLKQHHSNLTAVSYEAFDVAADGGLLDNNFTDITAGACAAAAWRDSRLHLGPSRRLDPCAVRIRCAFDGAGGVADGDNGGHI